MSTTDIQNDVQCLLSAAQDAARRCDGGDWQRVWNRLDVLRRIAEEAKCKLADAGLVPAPYRPEVPLVSIGQGEYRTDFYGSLHRDGEVPRD